MDNAKENFQLRPNQNVQLQTIFYNSARSELIERIKLRDAALLAYITVVGTFLGFILYKNWTIVDDSSFLVQLALPILCLIFTLVILQHHQIIGKLAHYTQWEVGFSSQETHWDASASLHGNRKHLNSRTIAQMLVLVFPLLEYAIFMWSNRPLFRQARIIFGASLDMRVIAYIILILLDFGVAGYIIYLHLTSLKGRLDTDHSVLNRIEYAFPSARQPSPDVDGPSKASIPPA